MKITRYIEPKYRLDIPTTGMMSAYNPNSFKQYFLNETELRIYMLEVAKGEKPYENVTVTNLQTMELSNIQSNGYLESDIVPDLNSIVTLQHMKLNSSLAS